MNESSPASFTWFVIVVVALAILHGCSDADDRAIGDEKPKIVEEWPWM